MRLTYSLSARVALCMSLLSFAGCGDDPDPAGYTKEEARTAGGRTPDGLDICEVEGWYGDGICDSFCPEEDPDCASCPDPVSPDVEYVSTDVDRCAVLRFTCDAGSTSFNNECGCGCVSEPSACSSDDDCRPGERCTGGECTGEACEPALDSGYYYRTDDCGRSLPACEDGFEAFTNACGCGCQPSEDCPDASLSTVRYVSEDPAECAVIRFRCEPGEEFFSGSCGCGCIGEPVACLADGDCAADERCVDGVCEGGPECLVDSDCPAGTACVEGECRGGPPPMCESSADCGLCEACADGECLPTPCRCSEDSECPAGSACSDAGTCEPVPGACLTDSDCPDGGSCREGTCIAACDPALDDPRANYELFSVRECAAAFIVCPPGSEYFLSECGCGCLTSDRECEADSDCPRGEACLSGVCADAPECLTSGDCRRGEVCARGECIPEESCEPSSDEGRRYIGSSPEECAVIRFACEDGEEAFSNECGCGCQPISSPSCDPAPGDEGVSFYGSSREECAVIRFACEDDEAYFINECGCGCEPAVACEPAVDDPRARYIGGSPEECAVIDFSCEDGSVAFSNECGCGCLMR